MFYEKRVTSRTQLSREITNLDSDAGIRLVGTYKGSNCFAFISKSVQSYALMLYSLVNREHPAPGRMLLAREFQRKGELEDFLDLVAGSKVDAFVY